MCIGDLHNHRALQQYLDQLWPLLWATAQPSITAHGQGATTSSSTSLAPRQVAVAVAQRLIGAYAELRQLEFLLSSLSQSLRSHFEKAVQGQAQAQGGAQWVDAAVAVLGDQAWLATLQHAVQRLPPGQCPAIIQFMSRDLERWLACRAPPQLLARVALIFECTCNGRLGLFAVIWLRSGAHPHI